eukprot:scaffold13758_cov120-Isochrysis_galbana.AAC.3
MPNIDERSAPPVFPRPTVAGRTLPPRPMAAGVGCSSASASPPRPSRERLRDSYVINIATPNGTSRATCANHASRGSHSVAPPALREVTAASSDGYTPACSRCLTSSHGTRSVDAMVFAKAAETATRSSGGAKVACERSSALDDW